MLDCELFGLAAGWHHLISLAIHMLGTIFLFLAFRRLSGAAWPSLLVAGLFALHPLHVESVAWIAQRKDVLAGLFWALSLWSYANWVRRGRSAGWYVTLLICFSLGLMSKPTVVTLPCVLLLLDFWPLRRLTDLRDVGALRRRVVEKLNVHVGGKTPGPVVARFHVHDRAQAG